MGFSLFADDGAMWKRGKNVEFIVKKVQESRVPFVKKTEGVVF